MRYSSISAYSIMTMTFMAAIGIGNIYAEPLLMPKELIDVAKEKGCKQIIDFYNRPGMVEPPFVYGYVPGLKENSAVFWCEIKPKKYQLVVFIKTKKSNITQCPDTINWSNYPGGLSVVSSPQTKLDDFVYVNDKGAIVPKGLTMKNIGILSYYDGVETLFYCLEGKWLVRQRQ